MRGGWNTLCQGTPVGVRRQWAPRRITSVARVGEICLEAIAGSPENQMCTGIEAVASARSARRDAKQKTSMPVRLESLEPRTLLAATDPFTFVVMPDTQYYSQKYPDIFS